MAKQEKPDTKASADTDILPPVASTASTAKKKRKSGAKRTSRSAAGNTTTKTLKKAKRKAREGDAGKSIMRPADALDTTKAASASAGPSKVPPDKGAAPRDEKRRKGKPSVDIAQQAALGAEVPPKRDLTREVFNMIVESATALHEKGLKRGALIVIGRFASIGQIRGARQLPLPGGSPNPFEGQYLSAGDKVFQRMLLQDEILGDGAVVVDASGQVLGGRIYLLIDHPELEIPEGCATRHLAAASTSMRRDVEAVVTLSEETNVARIFVNGKVVKKFDPNVAEEKAKRAKRKRGDTARRPRGTAVEKRTEKP